MTEKFSNFAESTLGSSITSGATTLTVASAAKFPSTGNFHIVVTSLDGSGFPVNPEIMLVTVVAGATFTVTRAQESTSAQAHSAGEIVAHIMTAGLMSNLVNGPVSSTVGHLAVFNSTDGKLLSDSGVAIANFLQATNNLADLGNTSTAQQNLFSPYMSGTNTMMYWAGSNAQTDPSINTDQSGALYALSLNGGSGNPFTGSTFPLTARTGVDENWFMQTHTGNFSTGSAFAWVNDANTLNVPGEFRASQMQFNTSNTGRSNVGNYDVLLDTSGNLNIGKGRNLIILGATSGSTTLAVLAAASGTLTLPSATDTLVGRATTDTLTNKRMTKRVTTVADATSISVNADNFDAVVQTNTQAAGTLTINNPTGTPTDKQSLQYETKCTNAQGLSFGTAFAGGTIPLPTSTTGGGKTDQNIFQYSSLVGKWLYTGQAPGF